MQKKKVNYNIGLDIGTNSVGWAVTDAETGEIKIFKKKKMLGTRLFEAGDSAEVTRQKRGTRRRYNRRRERIELLRELMKKMVLSEDENFFRRLDEAFLHQEDKKIKTEHILFNDENYTDQDYYDSYKTIYHLRKELSIATQKADARLIYLALHNLIKYRGHFLYEGQKFSEVNSSAELLFEEMFEKIIEFCEYEKVNYDKAKVLLVVQMLKNAHLSKREKQDQMKNLLINTMPIKNLDEITKLILGYAADFSVIFQEPSLCDEGGKKLKLAFNNEKYETLEPELMEKLDEKSEILEVIKKINSWFVLQEILQGRSTIAEAMCAKYEKHQADLKLLKKYMKEHCSNQTYNSFFREELNAAGKYIKNYVNYIAGETRCSQEELYKTIKEIIQDDSSELAQTMIADMEADNFLLKLNTKKNASVPYQLSLLEAEKIIDHQSEYYPELKMNKDKILSLITFRIPYYVGPMNNSSRFSWVVRLSQDKIYPWNMEEIIDIDQTAENFIKRMTNKCSYLNNEDVMPRQSLLYNEFILLNELNKIRINDKLIAFEDKQKMIKELFCKKKTVKEAGFIRYLKSINYQNTDSYDIQGYQKEKEFSSSLSSYIDFVGIFGEINLSNIEMIEKVIYWLTVFEDKKIIKRKIEQNFKNRMTEKQLEAICKLKYKGWSRISQKLLNGMKTYSFTPEGQTIIQIMRSTNQNFMQIINDKKYGFDKLILKENQGNYKENIKIEDVMELQGSPAIKKGIWQTICIIKEITSIMDEEPENIFVEFAREENEKVRASSRENTLKKCYEKLREQVNEYNRDIEIQLKEKKYARQLDREKMLLYFMQNGKCMYTEKPLDIDKLDLYQVDHILPQAYIKDDSLENKALVTVDANQIKTDKLLLDERIRKDRYYFWTALYKSNLIGAKKYHNLLRETIGENETKGFINRQLVETRQITKHVAGLLTESYPNSNIVSIRADLTHNFREKYNLYKSRDINDFHHAHDAFLASYIGTFLMKTFPGMENELIYNKFLKYRKQKKRESLLKSKYGYILSLFDDDVVSEDGEIIWKPSYITNIKHVIDGDECLVTKKLEEQTGAFYKETIYRKKSKDATIPLKKGLSVEKYGGYTGRNIAYMNVVQYHKGKKMVKQLIGIPCYIAALSKTDPNAIEHYLQQETGAEEYIILKEHIKKYQKIVEDGNLLYLTSDSEVINAKQFIYRCKDTVREKDKNIFMKCISNHCEENEHISEEVKRALRNTFDYIILKSKNQYKLYSEIFEKIGNAVDFDSLEYKEKIDCLLEMLKITSASAACANMAKFSSNSIKLSDRMGRKSKHSLKIEKCEFIDESITGLYERRYRL